MTTPPDTEPLRPVRESVRQRFQVYGCALVLTQILFLVSAVVLRLWLILPDGTVVIGDFAAFWSASRMAIAGQAQDTYDWMVHKSFLVTALGQDFEGFYAWHNPPHFFLLLIPFALPPYLVGWLLWVLVTAAFFAAMLRLVVPGWLVPVLLGAPATLWCAVVGQTGFLIAGLVAGSLALLDRRPWVAGILLGLATTKPQFGVLFPLFLLLERRWTTFAAAAMTTIAMSCLAWFLFGTATWLAFFHSVSTSGEALMAGGASWFKLQSLYAIGYRAGLGLHSAMLAQAALTIALAALLVWQRRQGAPFPLRAATLAAAAYLATPYVYIYDAVLLTTAIAFLLKDGLARGLSRVEIALILLSAALPGAFQLIGSFAAPAGCVVLLAIVVSRSASAGRQSLAPEQAGDTRPACSA